MTFTDKILAGLREACWTSFCLKKGDFTKIKPEYLLTALVAKQFASPDSGLLVKLEESTIEFATSCVKQVNSSYQFSKTPNDIKKGRIDIAVYFQETQDGYWNRNKSKFPIELKGVDPKKRPYLKDVDRNLKYFEIEDKHTGKSVLKRAFNVSIVRAKRYLSEEDVDNFINKIENKYGKWLKEYEQKLSDNNLELKITVEDVLSNLYSRNISFDLSEGLTEWDYMQDCYLYVGVVVEISRKSAPQ